ncbi:MAG: hypothetical protein JNK02_04320 [Planctomycetes bacterium]|nr:hypothetical protein [Planctomycetota bacterium]
MHPLIPTRSGAPIALLFVCATSAFAQMRSVPSVPEPANPPGAPGRIAPAVAEGIDWSRVWHDEPGDGRLWARGERWKASFGADGAVYFPSFGPRQEQSLPHALSPASVTIGGEPLAFLREVPAARSGDRIELDRGAFVEAYELEPDQIEQLFVFPSLPRAGEIVLRIPVQSALAGAETAAGLEFRGDLGRVTYSRAIAIDGEGRRVSAPTRFEDGAIVIRVGADFLATAAMPLTIDPTVMNIWLDSVSDRDTYQPDAVWDSFNQVWMVTYEQVFAGADTDIFVKSISASGATIASAWIDFTSAGWHRPRIAYNGVLHNSLVACEVTTTTPYSIQTRTVRPNGTILTLGVQTSIGGSAGGNKRFPDVGGDPHPSQGYFCVVFQREINAQEGEIGYRLLDADGTPFGIAPTYLPRVFNAPDTQPAISRSNDMNEWLVAFRRNDVVYRGDIYGARIAWHGGLVDGPFGITAFGLANDQAPSVSSPLRGTLQTLVAFQRNSLASTNFGVWVVPVNGSTASQQIDVTILEGSGQSAVAQIEPSIDSDGQHFLLTYSEFDPDFLNYDVFASDLFLSGGQIGIAQAHVNVNHMGLSQRNSQVAAQRSATGGGQRYFLAYDIRQSDTEHDVAAALFDGYVGGQASTFCFGDGTGLACPCGNSGSAGRGCANSVNAAGAVLTTTGVASTQNDTLQLHAAGMPNSVCLFFQGTSSSPVTFGDGLRCVAGTVVRLATRAVNLGNYTFPTGIDLPLATTGLVPLDGGTRTYQVWYRNAASYCTSATFNLTNGVSVEWSR